MITVARDRAYSPRPGHVVKAAGDYGVVMVEILAVRHGRVSGRVRRLLWDEMDPDSVTQFYVRGDMINFPLSDITAVVRRDGDADGDTTTSDSDTTSTSSLSSESDYSVEDEVLEHLVF